MNNYYGVKCREFDEYIIIQGETAEELFGEHGVEAVFDTMEKCRIIFQLVTM